MVKLSVNIDHIATIRQARRGREPDPVWAVGIVELAGADGITVHLREDRRHIYDRDVELISRIVQTEFNLEMSTARDIVNLALKLHPHLATLVPERREEITTEGGLDVATHEAVVNEVVSRLKKEGIVVSLFIDPESEVIEASSRVGADYVELHTGCYANATSESQRAKELKRLQEAARQAVSSGLRVHAGHGLNYTNVLPVAKIPEVEALYIGHSIISRAVFVGLERAVREMKALIKRAVG